MTLADACDEFYISVRKQNKHCTEVKNKQKQNTTNKQAISNQRSRISILKFSTTVAIMIYVSLYSVSLELRMIKKINK